MRILVLLVTFGIGILIMAKSLWLVNTVGRIGWAERNLGRGGSFTLYRLIGVAVIVFGMIYATGLVNQTFGAIFGLVGPPR